MATKKTATKKRQTAKAKDGVRTDKTSEALTHERDENLVNAPVAGVKAGGQSERERTALHPNDDPESQHFIKPPTSDDDGTRQHHVRASRGEEVGFYQIPQGGIFNNTNLKA